MPIHRGRLGGGALTNAVALLVAIGLTAAGAWQIYRALNERPAVASRSEVATEVRILELLPESMELSARSTGFLRAPATIRLGAETAGRVLRRHRDEGDSVERGEVILELDDTRYRSQVRMTEARLEGLAAELRFTLKELERTRTLVEKDSLHPADLDRMQSEADRLRATIEENRARLDEAKRDVERCRIEAPRRGVLYRDQVEVGEYVAAGAPVGELRVLDPLELEVEVPAHVRLALELGRQVEVRLEDVDASLHDQEAVVSGTLVRLPAGSRQETRRFPVVFEIANPERDLVPGLFASVELRLSRRQEVVTVPKSAVRRRYGEHWVYRVEADGEGRSVARERIVQISPIRGRPDRWRVLGGLAERDRIVTYPIGELRDGDRVRVGDGVARVERAASPSAPSPSPGE